MARKRSNMRKNWPKHLEQNEAGVFYYRRRPFMANRVSFGKDFSIALQRARELNRRFDQLENEGKNNVQAGVVMKHSEPFSRLMREFTEWWICDRRLKESSATLLRARSERMARRIGSVPLDLIEVEQLHNMIKGASPFEWNKMRTHLINFYKWAKGLGYFSSYRPNPAESLLTKRQPPKARKRMTLDQFQTIYHYAESIDEYWCQDIMLLCLYTTLRRSDLVNLRFDQFDGEWIYTSIAKSQTAFQEGKRLAIWLPPEARKRIAFAQERAAPSRCPFIIHRMPRRIDGRKKHHCQITPHYASHLFAKIRDASGACDGIEHPPTLHEIRALSSYLFKQQGTPLRDIQRLMAHTDATMTAYYQSGHDTEEFERIHLPLDITL